MSEVWIFCSFDSAHHIVAVPACIKEIEKMGVYKCTIKTSAARHYLIVK